MSTAIFATKDYVDSHSGGTLYLTSFYGRVATIDGNAYIQGSVYTKQPLIPVSFRAINDDSDAYNFLHDLYISQFGSISLTKHLNLFGYLYPLGAPSPQNMNVVGLSLSGTNVRLKTFNFNTAQYENPTYHNISNGTSSGVTQLNIISQQIL